MKLPPRESWKTPADGRKRFSRIMTHRKNSATVRLKGEVTDTGLYGMSRGDPRP